MNAILVATDFSPASENAAAYAAEMALVVQKELVLLHIYSLQAALGGIPLATDDTNMCEDAETALVRLKEKLDVQAEGRLTIHTEIRMGSFFNELQLACERLQPYTVVMGSQGTTAAERFIFGGHTVYSMQHLRWPLITVPPEAKFLYVRRIGLACDLENVSDITPVGAITKLVKDFNASLHVLNVGRGTDLDEQVKAESHVLQEMLAEVDPLYHFIAHGDTNKGLVEFVEHFHIHLLIVLPRQHDLTDKLIRKSHTKELVMHSQVPVMALHK